jgi:hypothetical protein
MGVVKPRRIGQVSSSAIEDHWQRLATTAAIEAARGVVKFDGPIPPLTPIGRLNDIEWGWVLAAMLFAWIVTRSEQATAEQIDTEQAIRLTGLDPEPWDIGAINTILPQLADACPGIDWSRPLASWSREEMADFLLVAIRLIRKAMIARDLSDKGVSRRVSAAEISRQSNAAAGGPLMTPDELNDDIGI